MHFHTQMPIALCWMSAVDLVSTICNWSSAKSIFILCLLRMHPDGLCVCTAHINSGRSGVCLDALWKSLEMEIYLNWNLEYSDSHIGTDAHAMLLIYARVSIQFQVLADPRRGSVREYVREKEKIVENHSESTVPFQASCVCASKRTLCGAHSWINK